MQKRPDKKCIQCGKVIKNAWKTKLYCSPKCTRKHYYDENPKRALQYVLKSRKLHIDQYKKYEKEYRLKNHEEIKRRMDKYGAECRKTRLATVENGEPITYKNVIKRPKPVDKKCEVCGKVHGKGHLDYHHWGKIEKAPKVTPGIWVGNKCHVIIEYNEQEYASMIFTKYLEKKNKIIKELGD